MAECNLYYSEFDEDKNTKLHFAVAGNDTEQVKELLESGCKLDSENCLGWTPLMMAARNGYFDMVKLLIDHKADATKRNAYGSSVLLTTAAGGNLRTLTFLLQHLLNGGVSRQSMEVASSPYIIAMLFDHDHLMHVLLKYSFNINAAAPITGITPIMFAAITGNRQRYGWLFANGADALCTNANHQSAASILFTKQWKELPDLVGHEQRQEEYEKEVLVKLESQKVPEKRETKRRYRQNKSAPKQEPFPSSSRQNSGISGPPYEQNPNYCYLSPHPQFCPSHHAQKASPFVYISSQPTFLNVPQHNDVQGTRKSSGVMSPLYMVSPSFSPIIPQFPYPAPQAFFPPDFDPNNLSPSPLSADNSFLNHHIYQPQILPQFGYNMPSLYHNIMETQSHHTQC